MLRSLSTAGSGMEDEEQQHSNYEIEMRDGLELRYHIGEPGNWVKYECCGVSACAHGWVLHCEASPFKRGV